MNNTTTTEVPFWLSWYHLADTMGPFEIHNPWWITGHRSSDDASTIVCAIRARDEDAAKEKIMTSYDNRPDALEWRFCEPQAEGWAPFGDRFQRGEWMQW